MRMNGVSSGACSWRKKLPKHVFISQLRLATGLWGQPTAPQPIVLFFLILDTEGEQWDLSRTVVIILWPWFSSWVRPRQ
jgi:hypothetical protein